MHAETSARGAIMPIVAAIDWRSVVSAARDASDELDGRSTSTIASRGESATDSASEPSRDCMSGPASPMDAQAKKGGTNTTQNGHGT